MKLITLNTLLDHSKYIVQQKRESVKELNQRLLQMTIVSTIFFGLTGNAESGSILLKLICLCLNSLSLYMSFEGIKSKLEGRLVEAKSFIDGGGLQKLIEEDTSGEEQIPGVTVEIEKGYCCNHFVICRTNTRR